MAASYQVAPPETFKFKTPEEWPKWIRRFERFRCASGLDKKDKGIQVNTLVYCMGDEADDILGSFHLSTEEKAQYDVVKEKFEGYFVKRRNVIFERAKFNQRRQEPGEPVDNFITSLHCLSEHCGYGDLREQMIRDRIVVGIQDISLSEKLQLEPNLTLETAVTAVRQREAVKKQQSTVRSQTASTPAASVDALQQRPPHTKRSTSGKQPRRQGQASNPETEPNKAKVCGRCGKSPFHKLQMCPAKDSTCRKCGKKGHYQAVCRSRTIGDVTTEDDLFLGALHEDISEPWTATILINDKPIKFKLDTGADVTVISAALNNSVVKSNPQPSKKTLLGPDRNALPVTGQFVANLKAGSSTCNQTVYVVPELHTPLLGRPAIEALQLVKRVGSVEDNKPFDPQKLFPALFQSLGKLQRPYHIQLKDDAKPLALTAPRRVPVPLLPKVKTELDRMKRLGVIVPVKEPTDWCSGMVVVPKPQDKVRICVDLTQLNKSVRREHHQLPAVEQTLAQLAGAKVFSKLDANSGFWQIPLTPESSLLTTFITPFGRFCFRRLPFGITSAPEHFQCQMAEILQDLEGVVCHMDDILVHGQNHEEHEKRLKAVLHRLQGAGLTLNPTKCEFLRAEVKFLGQIIDDKGIHPDPAKITAIQNVSEPKCVADLRRFLGMTNQMSKFLPSLADTTQPLRELLKANTQWVWEEPQKQSFLTVKKALCSSPVLAIYDPNRETILSADASSFGLGAVLQQKQEDGTLRPIAYISRAMTSTEQRYGQIEKEALALTWACERLADYLIGLQFNIETDHKPLVPLLNTKNLEDLPIRVQRFKMRLMRFSFLVSYVPGKHLITADALSRAPLTDFPNSEEDLYKTADAYACQVLSSLPATDNRIQTIQKCQTEDEVCQNLMQYCNIGWPSRKTVPNNLKPYCQVASELSIVNGLLLRGSRIVIPTSLRVKILDQIHTGHQGISKCRQRAGQSVWWPGLSKQLEELVKNCEECGKHQIQRAEPLLPSRLPNLPWQKLGTDLFEWNKSTYLIIVDYYSRYIELSKLRNTSAEEVISQTKSIFARHGIPEELFSDNGPQFSSEAFTQFAQSYGFKHVTSSPYFPQSNGEAERAVQTIKNLMKKKDDLYLAILAYRATPTELGYSPAELLMSRKLRTTVPLLPELRKPVCVDPSLLAEKDAKLKARQKRNFDERHGTRELSPLHEGDTVWIPDRHSSATVTEETAPRSYIVDTGDGTFRRNRRHLLNSPQSDNPDQPDPHTNDDSQNGINDHDPGNDQVIKTRSGRVSRPPLRLNVKWS